MSKMNDFPPLPEDPTLHDVINAVKWSHDRVYNRLVQIDTWIHGNGEPGAKAQIQQLQDQAEKLKWFSRASITAAIGALAAVIVKLVHIKST